DRARETFLERCEHRDVGAGEDLGHVVATAEELHIVPDAELEAARLEIRPQRPVAHEPQPEALAAALEDRGCLEQRLVPLDGLEPRHACDRRHAGRRVRALERWTPRPEAPDVYAVSHLPAGARGADRVVV